MGHIHFFPYAYSPIFNTVGYTLVAIAAFFVVAYARLCPDALPTRLLRIGWLRKLGEISYGAYVYSWVILQLLTYYFPSLSKHQAGFLHIVLGVPVSAVLFHYYEKPITLWGRRLAAELGTKAQVSVTNTDRRSFEVEHLVLAAREEARS